MSGAFVLPAADFTQRVLHRRYAVFVRMQDVCLSCSALGTEKSMTTLQAVALGAMLAWTPSLIILAASLWDVRELEGME
jgi:hypothetical protein